MSGIIQGFLFAMLTPKQQRAVAAIHSSSSFKETAKKVGVADRTLRRWLEKDGGKGEGALSMPVERSAWTILLDSPWLTASNVLCPRPIARCDTGARHLISP